MGHKLAQHGARLVVTGRSAPDRERFDKQVTGIRWRRRVRDRGPTADWRPRDSGARFWFSLECPRKRSTFLEVLARTEGIKKMNGASAHNLLAGNDE